MVIYICKCVHVGHGGCCVIYTHTSTYFADLLLVQRATIIYIYIYIKRCISFFCFCFCLFTKYLPNAWEQLLALLVNDNKESYSTIHSRTISLKISSYVCNGICLNCYFNSIPFWVQWNTICYFECVESITKKLTFILKSSNIYRKFYLLVGLVGLVGLIN